MDRKKYFIVDSSSLPEIFTKVVTAKELLESNKVANVTEAINTVGISRSAFYKYRDSVSVFKESRENYIEMSAVLADRAGVLSAMSSVLCKNNVNIITMIQSEPKYGVAEVSFKLDIDNILVPIANLIAQLEKIDGVILAKAL